VRNNCLERHRILQDVVEVWQLPYVSFENWEDEDSKSDANKNFKAVVRDLEIDEEEEECLQRTEESLVQQGKRDRKKYYHDSEY
jgi:hypothetical protein